MTKNIEQGKPGFVPISMEDYIALHLKGDHNFTRDELEKWLKSSLSDFKRGVKCSCGNPLWVIGSAIVGNACFTCITGEAFPDGDYEIDEALQ
jgi:hypothetical protein